MINIKRLIKEEVARFLKEYEGYDDVDLYDKQSEMKYDMLNDFLLNNNADFTKRILWKVVPAARLKKIWNDYIKYGIVRDEKGLNYISGIMIRNALNLDNLTYLSGHTSGDPNYDFEEAWEGYIEDYIGRVAPRPYVDTSQTEIPFSDPSLPHIRKQYDQNFIPNPNFSNIQNRPFQEYIDYLESTDELKDTSREEMREKLKGILVDHFYDNYSIDSKGIDIMSDYGTGPLVRLAFELAKENDSNKQVVIIDKMLNIVHQRSDLASWFVEGGSAALSDISGYYSDERYSWDQKSVISGKQT